MTETFNLPVIVPDREPLTELEARRVGDAAYRLARFRRLLKAAQLPKSGALYVGPPATSSWSEQPLSMNLSSYDLQAALALLIEREELFLASFNVQVEKPLE